MALDITSLLVCIVLPIITAISGLWQAKQKGEIINWPIFAKTIVIGVVAAGFITSTQADLVVALVSTEVVTYALDQLVNAIVNKVERTAAPAA